MPANVKVVIDAITKPAQKGIDNVSDKLTSLRRAGSVARRSLSGVGDSFTDVSSKSAIVIGALGRVKSNLRDVSIPARLAANAIEEVGEEAVEAAIKLGTMVGALGIFGLLSTLASAFLGVSFAIGAVTTALIGLSSIAVALMGPLALIGGAIGGIAIAFGAILGSGILAWGKGFSKTMKSVGKQVKGLVKDFGQQFVPLIRDAVKAIPAFIKAILNVIPPLDIFVKALRDIGAVAFRVIPQIIGFMLQLGKQALPILRKIASVIMKRLGAAFRSLRGVISNIDVNWKALTNTVFDFLAALYKIGNSLLSFLIPAVKQVLGWLNQFVQILTNPPAKILKYLNRMSVAFGKLFKAARPFIKSLGPLLKQLGKLGAIVLFVATKLATKLMPALTKLVKGVTRVLKFINKLITSFRKTKKPMNATSRRMNRLRQRLVGAKQDVNSFVKVFRMGFQSIKRIATTILKTVRKAFNRNSKKIQNIMRNLFGLLNGIVKVFKKQFLKYIRNVVTGWQKFFRQNKQKIKKIIKTTVSLILTIIDTLLGGLRKAWKNHGKNLVASIRRYFETIQRVFQTVLGIIIDIVLPILKRIQKFWKQHGDQIKFLVKALTSTVMRVITFFMNTIAGTINKVLDLVKEAWDKWGNDIIAIVKFLTDVIMTTIGTFLDLLVGAIKAGLAIINGDWDKAWKIIKNTVSKVLDNIMGLVNRWIDNIGRAIGWIVDKIVGYFQDLYHKLVGGSIIPDMLSDIIDAITSWNIVSTFKSVIKSVLRTLAGLVGNFLQLGEDFLTAVVRGISNITGDLVHEAVRAAEKAANGLVNAFNRVLPNQLSVPRVSIGGGSIQVPSVSVPGVGQIGGQTLSIPSMSFGGQTLNIPQLDSGGFITGDGLAFVHENEMVIPEAQTRALMLDTEESDDGTNTYNIRIRVNADSDTDGRDIADEIAQELRSRNFN